MAKRKPTDKAQMNLRLPEKLRSKVEAEAKKNGASLNAELVRRLEKSFVDQGFEALIQSSAQAVGLEVFKQMDGLVRDLISEFNDINRALGRSSTLDIKLREKEGDTDG